MKRVIRKKETEGKRDTHELLQQDDFAWPATFRNVLDPYWSARLEYRSTGVWAMS